MANTTYMTSKLPRSKLWGIMGKGAAPPQVTDGAAFLPPASWGVSSGEFYEVEDWVRDWLAQQYPGSHFRKNTLKLTTGGNHEFDAVSHENSIVAGVTGHSWKTKSGNLPSAKYDGLYRELYFLSLVRAAKKLLILTNEDMYRDFKNKSEGKVAQSIEIIFCQLPVDMRRKVAEVQKKASEEQKV